jgi:hypothetical protein
MLMLKYTVSDRKGLGGNAGLRNGLGGNAGLRNGLGGKAGLEDDSLREGGSSSS